MVLKTNFNCKALIIFSLMSLVVGFLLAEGDGYCEKTITYKGRVVDADILEPIEGDLPTVTNNGF